MFKFTTHAIERFGQRVEPGLSYKQALRRLEKISAFAVAKKTKTKNGQQQWVIDEPRCCFITKRVIDGRQREFIQLVVTVLGADEMDAWNPEDPYAYEKELLAEYEAELAERRAKAAASKEHMEMECAEATKTMRERGFNYNPSQGKTKQPISNDQWASIIKDLNATNKSIVQYETTRENVRRTMDAAQEALRIAVQALEELAEHGEEEAQQALNGIRGIDRKFLSPGFVYNTKLENKRIVEK